MNFVLNCFAGFCTMMKSDAADWHEFLRVVKQIKVSSDFNQFPISFLLKLGTKTWCYPLQEANLNWLLEGRIWKRQTCEKALLVGLPATFYLWKPYPIPAQPYSNSDKIVKIYTIWCRSLLYTLYIGVTLHPPPPHHPDNMLKEVEHTVYVEVPFSFLFTRIIVMKMDLFSPNRRNLVPRVSPLPVPGERKE